MEQQNCQEETTNSENPLCGGNNLSGAKIPVEAFKVNRESLNRQNQKMTLKSLPTSGRSKVTSSISSSTPCASGRNILYSTEIHWCNKVYSHWSGRHARETYWWLLEHRFQQKFVRFLERIHKFYSIERETSQRKYVVRWETGKNSDDYETRSCVWPEVWTQIGKAAQNREKQLWKNEKPILDNARRLKGTFFIDLGWPWILRSPSKCEKKNWKVLWTQPCRAKRRLTLATGNWLRRWLHLIIFQKPSMVL